jgi:hypothetical protein
MAMATCAKKLVVILRPVLAQRYAVPRGSGEAQLLAAHLEAIAIVVCLASHAAKHHNQIIHHRRPHHPHHRASRILEELAVFLDAAVGAIQNV